MSRGGVTDMDRTDEVMARKANRFRAGITSLEELRRGI